MSKTIAARRSRAAAAPPPTIDRLRTVAANLFAARGYGGTSMSEIATGVGVSKAGIYNYFASKEELLMELLEESLEDWRQASQAGLTDQSVSFERRLWKHLQDAVAFATENPQQVAMVRVASTQLIGDFGRRVDALMTAQRRDYFAQLERLFAEAIERGEVRAIDPRDGSLAFRSMLDGILSNLIFHPRAADEYRRRLAGIWQLCWRGMAPAGAEEAG